MKSLKTTDLWVVYQQNSTELDDLYLKKDDAELVCKKALENLSKTFRKGYEFLTDEEFEIHFKCVYQTMFIVVTLNEAIMHIKNYLSECPNCQDASY